jgi:hypothetical protein
MIKAVPTTVMITYKGKVIVIFERSSLQYELTIDNLITALNNHSPDHPFPSPPSLLQATTTSLSLSWTLPDPPGVSQYVEIQFRKYRLSSDPNQLSLLHPPSAWAALVTRTWDKESFTSYLFLNLSPGISYQFRLRYRSHRGWSEYSDPSSLYTTQPDRPSTPHSPLSSAILPHAVHLSWSFPWHNGSLINSFHLEGKSVGEPTFHELFDGLMLSHIVFGLQPSGAYIFRLKACNAIGESSWSEYYSIQTPPQYSLPLRQANWRDDLIGFSDEFLLLNHRSGGGTSSDGDDERNGGRGGGGIDSLYSNAMRCRDAWRQYFDQQTQQQFYFNILTGSRQLQLPQVMRQSPMSLSSSLSEEKGSEDGPPQGEGEDEMKKKERKNDMDAAIEKSVQFRLKRFRFLKDLRSYRQEITRPNSDSVTRSSSSTHTLSVNRQTVVSDTYQLLSQMRSGGVGGELRKRFRVQFLNEIGIDSGGLTKEFYLLISNQMIRYLLWSTSSPTTQQMKKKLRKRRWVKLTTSHKIFFNEVTQSDLEPLYESHSTVVESQERLNCLSGKDYLRFVGRMIGKALYDNQLIDVPLSGLLLSYLVTGPVALNAPSDNALTDTEEEEDDEGDMEEGVDGKEKKQKKRQLNLFSRFIFTEEDFKDYDPDLYRSLMWMMTNDIHTGGLDEMTFTVTAAGTTGQEILLCKGGDERVVTEENKWEYLQYLIQWKTQYSVAIILQEFLEVSPVLTDVSSIALIVCGVCLLVSRRGSGS